MEDGPFHKFTTWLSDHILAAGIAAWLVVPDVREVLGLIGAVGAVILVVGRNYGMVVDNKIKKKRLEILEEQEHEHHKHHPGK